MHADELAIGVDLVRRLVDHSLPQYADLPIRPLPSTGSTNSLFGAGRGVSVGAAT